MLASIIKGEYRTLVLAVQEDADFADLIGVTDSGAGTPVVPNSLRPVDLTGATNLSMSFQKSDSIGLLTRGSALLAFLPAALTILTGFITLPAHGLAPGEKTQLTTTGVLPTGLSLATNYYVLVIDKDTIALSATPGGAAITPTDQGTGTHSLSLVTLALTGNPVLGLVALTLSDTATKSMRPVEKITVYMSYSIGSVTRMVKFDRAFTVIDPNAQPC